MAASGAIYRYKGPISKLKIRVSLEKRVSAQTVSTSFPVSVTVDVGTSKFTDDIPGSSKETFEMRELGSSNIRLKRNITEKDEITIGWQEKILSHREIELYADENNCLTARHQEYRQLIFNQNKKPTTKWLYTYVDEDEDEDLQPMTTIPGENIQHLRRRRTSKSQTIKPIIGFNRSVSTVIVNDQPTKLQRFSSCDRRMRIMVDFGSSRQSVLLAVISVDELNGILHIQPDFNPNCSRELLLNSNDIGKESYWFTMENASEVIDEQQRRRDDDLQNKLHSSRKSQISALVGHQFQTIPSDIVGCVNVFGEIVSADGFEYDQLYVNFCLELSNQSLTQLEGDHLSYSPLFGVTQTSRKKSVDIGDQRTTIAYFGHPFIYRVGEKLHTGTQCNPIQILFQVMSRDTLWNRYRTEGYGYLNLPNAPGCKTYRVKTWRPVARSLGGQLRRYFIGGSPELDDLSSAVGKTNTQQGSLLSKYGMQTESTGTLTVKLNIVYEKHPNADFGNDSFINDANFVGITSANSMTTLTASVSAVLMAFHRARKRMFAARENLNF